MGLFCVNFHVRSNDERAMAAALRELGAGQHELRVDGEWLSVFEPRASQQDDQWICELAGGVSRSMQAPAIAFLVHDSDIACYWLFDHGELLDRYNSCPDYFEDEPDDALATRGQPEVLVRYCRAGTSKSDLAEILAEKGHFAEGIIERLAERLGIDVDLALADYRDFADVNGFDESDEDCGDEFEMESESEVGHGLNSLLSPEAIQRVTGMLGQPTRTPASPQAQALVQAAAQGNVAEIDRLLSEGANIDEEAPTPLPAGRAAAGLGQLLSLVPQITTTPLLAAIMHKQRAAAERLLDRGADMRRVHPMFGTAVHAVAAAGNVELLQMLLSRGADPSARNAQGQTPLDTIATSRASVEKIAQLQSMMKMMGNFMPGLGQLAATELPLQGWDDCQRLLESHLAH